MGALTFLMVDFVIGDVTVYIYFCVLTFSRAIIFFLQGRPNGPDVPTKMRTDHIPAAITMVTDARLKTMQGNIKNNKREILLHVV